MVEIYVILPKLIVVYRNEFTQAQVYSCNIDYNRLTEYMKEGSLKANEVPETLMSFLP